MYDNGDVLPGLDDQWEFLGATVKEWMIGFSMFIVISVLAPDGRVGTMIPFMVIGWVATSYTFASLRKIFPDQEKGIRNYFMKEDERY